MELINLFYKEGLAVVGDHRHIVLVFISSFIYCKMLALVNCSKVA
jgi:hypothetical protein